MEWDDPDNQENPQNWSKRTKWANVTIITLQGTLSPLASSILAAGSINIAQDFHLTSPYTPNLPVGLYILGLGLGTILLAPLSEVYGRRIIYLSSFTVFTILNVGCALSPNLVVLAILRFTTGVCGSVGLALGGASIGDMFLPHERGGAQSVYSVGPTAGPILAPLIGTFIVDGTHTWRWLMWVMVIASAMVVILSLFMLKETYSPFIQRRHVQSRASAKSRSTDTGAPSPDAGHLLHVAMTRPLRLLLCAPICSLTALYMSLIYGILYLFLVTIPLLYGPEPVYNLFSYRWQHGLTGLAYLGPGAGIVTGMIICKKYMNRSYAFMARRTLRKTGSGTPIPECRMLFLQMGIATVPIGLIIYAWTAHFHAHWIAPLIGAALFSLGMLMTYVCVQTYVVDVFMHHSASALAAINFACSFVACIFAVVGFQLYKALGYAWGTMLIAFICIAMLPMPFLLYKFGSRLRRDFKFDNEVERTA